MKIKIIFSFLGLVFCFLFFNSVQARELLDVVINEIAWMGTKVEGVESEYWWQYEWIELYNNTNQEIDVTGWQIENGGTKNKPLEIPNAKIPAESFFLLCKKEVENCDFKNWSLSLNDNYQANGPLILKNNFGEIIDQSPTANSKKWPAGNKETKQTMERKDGIGPGSDPENWQTSQIPGGTPRAQNSLVTQTESKEEEKPSPKEELIEAKSQQPLTPGSANVIPAQETEGTEIMEEMGKIDINTASLKDSVKIVHIGKTRAQELISLRPFYSLDDLTRIRGISQKTLEDIKEQGLAWVDPKLERSKVEKTKSLEKGLAAVAEPLNPLGQDKQIPRSLFIFLIALVLAISSGTIILILKIKLRENKNLLK